MKQLMKLTLALIISAFSTNLYAQKFGFTGGLNLANMHAVEDDGTFGNQSSLKPGFHIGPTIELPFNETFSFASGTILSTKGFKYKISEEFYGLSVDANYAATLYYIDIPLTVKGRWSIGQNTQLYGVLGPYCAIGISGKIKGSVSFLGETATFNEPIEWGNGLSRFDLGFTAGTGIAFKNINLGVSYQYGVVNDVQNRVLAISTGYLFGK